jgi:hypothetical protein
MTRDDQIKLFLDMEGLCREAVRRYENESPTRVGKPFEFGVS